MATQLRALFYVTSIDASKPNQGGGTIYRTAHLNAAFSNDPKSIKNDYWKASPNGKCKMCLHDDWQIEGFDPKVGEFYWIDCYPTHEETGPDVFKVTSVKQYFSGVSEPEACSQEEVIMQSDSFWSTFEISIDNKAAHGFYAGGKKYKLVFTKAENV